MQGDQRGGEGDRRREGHVGTQELQDVSRH